LILEIKAPFKGRASELWKSVAADEVPAHYWWQVQHQLFVAGAELAHLYVFDGTEGILLDVRPKPEVWPQITKAWDDFQQFLDSNTPPPLTDRDTRTRTDSEWQVAAMAYIQAKRLADESATTLDAVKTSLIALTSHTSEAGAGVKVTRFWKTGAVDYKKIEALKGIDLDQYRGKAREEIRITVA
jgi:hypothetical protein